MTEEVRHVLKSDIRKQYEYFVKKVADFGEVWSLKEQDGWVTLGQGDKDYFPIWPKKDFVDICIGEEWSNCHAESIDLEEFLEDWIDNLHADDIKPTVMWSNGTGIDIEWDRLRDDIENELENY